MNPRVLKEASALASAGYRIQVLGADFSKKQLSVDQELSDRRGFEFVSVVSVGEENLKRRLQWFFYRTRRKFGSELQKRLHRDCLYSLGYCIPELLSSARAAKADFYVVHLEQAMFVGASLLNSGFRVGMDMEDWFSEDLPPEARKQRPVKLLRSLEQKLLRECTHATCTSRAMSRALAAEYGCRPPAVIYNAFPWEDRLSLDGKTKDRRDLNLPSLHWYSQTLGTDRGLGDLFAALPLMKKEFEIHLRGNTTAGFEHWLTANVPEPWRKRVFLHPLVSNDELLSRIAEHDIGFAGELRYCKNKEFTVSNKILHYLLGGLAVLASDTAGQTEIAAKANGAVQLYRSGDSASLANELKALLSSPESLGTSKAAALAASANVFCWERQVPCLLEGVKYALAN